MPKRFLLILIFSIIPLTVTADDLTPATPAGLGPDTAKTAGGSNADAGALQPAGVSPLQSTSNSAAGLTAPSNLLQGSTPDTDVLQVIANEVDGAPVTPAGDSPEAWFWLLPVLALGALGVAVVLRDRRRFGSITP